MKKENRIADIVEGKCDDAKSRIMKAALEEFAMHAPSSARTRHIAAKAGVNHAAICYYFGGKEGLYAETIKSISDFIDTFLEPFAVRTGEIEKTRSPEDAKVWIHDFVMSRVCVDSKTDDVLRDIILIITREEMYQTEAFDTIFARVIKPSNKMIGSMLEIASRGKCVGLNAKILAQMLLGQVMLFNSARAGCRRINEWKRFGPDEYKAVEKVFSGVLSRILP